MEIRINLEELAVAVQSLLKDKGIRLKLDGSHISIEAYNDDGPRRFTGPDTAVIVEVND